MIPLRLAQELTYQLGAAEENDRLAMVLSTPAVFMVLNADLSDLLLQWNVLAKKGYSPERYIVWARNGPTVHSADFLRVVSQFFKRRSNLDHAQQFAEALVSNGRETGNEKVVFDAYHALADIEIEKGNHMEALEYAELAISAANKTGDRKVQTKAILLLAGVYFYLGKYDQSMSLFEDCVLQFRQMNDALGAAHVAGNIAIIQFMQGSYELARIGFEEQNTVYKANGNLFGEMEATSRLAAVYTSIGQHTQALELFEHARTISVRLGSELYYMSITGDIGITFQNIGKYQRALEYLQEHRDRAESLGQVRSVAIATGSIGSVLLMQERYKEAFVESTRALELSSSIGFQYGVSLWLADLAEESLSGFGTGIELAPVEQAKNWALECLQVSTNLKNASNIHRASLLLSKCDAAQGNNAVAIQTLEGMLKEETDSQRAGEIAYEAWKLSQAEEYHEVAIRAFQAAYAKSPFFRIKKRLAELRGEPVPLSADDLSVE